jgi:predicted permease
MHALIQDVRFAARQLRKSPWFAVTAIVTLALGIGANTAVFSALNALLLQMLPVREPQQLYTVLLMNGGTQAPNTFGTGNGNTSFTYPVFRELRKQSRVFSDLIAHVPLGLGKVPVRYGDAPTEKAGEEVSGNYFSGLGVGMLRGTGFSEADERNHNSVVVLSYGFWTEAFSRDPSVIGRTLYIKNVPFTIAGVTAPGFFGANPGSAVDFWIPLQTRPELNAWGTPADSHTLYGSPNWWALPMLARLAPGVTPAQAQQALQPVFWQAASEGAGTLDAKRWPAHLGFEPIKGIAGYAKWYRAPVEIMMALVGLVLLIACTNVALLILARNAARQREFAVRMAMGAGVSRLFRQLITESLLLVAAGAVLGWGLAIGATRALALWARITTGLAPDRHVLLFTLCIAALATLAFGLAPLRATRQIAVEQALKSNSTNMTQSRGRLRSGNAAIALQIAMCLTLLVASGLTVRTLLNYEHQDLGMRAESLLIFDVNPPDLANDAQAISFYGRLIARVKAIPGVDAAALVQTRPGSGWRHSGEVIVDGVDVRESSGSRAEARSNFVGADFFHTMGISILQGRDITDADVRNRRGVVAVNETFAQRFLKNGALGHRTGRAGGAEIVAVVKDSKYARVEEDDVPTIYYSLSQDGFMGQMTVEVRTSADPMALLPEMRHAIHELAPNMPLQKPMTQEAQFAETYVTPRLFARLALAFGALAAVLVATGLYGTLVYRVQRRRGEIGLRMAVGAQRVNVLIMILRESLMIAAAGFAIGLPMSFAVSRLLRTQLYHLNYLDAPSFSIAAAITLFVALGAALLPARKASRIEPMEALRTE